MPPQRDVVARSEATELSSGAQHPSVLHLLSRRTVCGLPEVLTPKEVAEFLGYPLSTVWALLRRGEIPSAFLGRRRRVLRKDVLAAFCGKSDSATAAPSIEPFVLPDRVEPVGRPGRPRKCRRRFGVRADDATARSPPRVE